MNADAFRQIEAIFDEALTMPAAKRQEYVRRACGTDEQLRHRVTCMLGYDALTDDGDTSSDHGLLDPALKVRALDISTGDRIGPYCLEELIGEGGFGLVFRARQEEPIQRDVALKIIKLGMDTERVIARFAAERQTLAVMDHPFIARVFDAGATPAGRPYFVMELTDGISVTRYCDDHDLDLEARLRLFLQLCDAVQHAHRKGIIHRDIKPSNILVADGVDGPMPKVIDFGIAKATSQPDAREGVTEARQAVGTPAYMSPEQAEPGDVDVDTRTDVYALGVVMYELLAGVTPFAPENGNGRITDPELRRDPRRPSTRVNGGGGTSSNIARHGGLESRTLARRLRGDLDWIALRAIAYDREERYGTVAELAQDLERFLADEPVKARPPGRVYLLRKFVRRQRVAVAAGTAVVLALLIGLILALVGFGHANTERDRAVDALWTTLLAQARAGRTSNEPGRRYASLAALARAAAIRPDAVLRDEAVACLALPDVLRIRTADGFDDGGAWGLRIVDRCAGTPARGEIVVRSTDDGRLLSHLQGPPLDVRRMLFSPFGRYLAAKYHTERDVRVLVWSLDDQKPLLEHENQGDASNGMVFDPVDAPPKWFAVAGSDQAVHVYSLPDGRPLRKLPLDANVRSITSSPDGAYIAAADFFGRRVIIVDVATGNVERSFETASGLRGVDWSPDGALLAGAGADECVYLWDAENGEQQHVLCGHAAPVTEVMFGPKGRVLASTGWDGLTRLWHVDTARELLGPIVGVYLVGFGDELVTRHRAILDFWEINHASELRLIRADERFGPVAHLDLDPPGQTLVTAGLHGVELWDIASGEHLLHISDERAADAWFEQDGAGVTAALDDGLHRWSLTRVDGAMTASDEAMIMERRGITAGLRNPSSGRLVVSTYSSAEIIERSGERRSLPPFTGLGSALSMSADGRMLLTSSWRGPGARVWDVEQVRMLAEFPGSMNGAISPDGRHVVVTSGHLTEIYETSTWERTTRIDHEHGHYVSGPVIFSHDGSIAAVGVARYEIILLHIETGRAVTTLRSPEVLSITDIAFGPGDDMLLAITSHDLLQIWDLKRIRASLRAIGLDWSDDAG